MVHNIDFVICNKCWEEMNFEVLDAVHDLWTCPNQHRQLLRGQEMRGKHVSYEGTIEVVSVSGEIDAT